MGHGQPGQQCRQPRHHLGNRLPTLPNGCPPLKSQCENNSAAAAAAGAENNSAAAAAAENNSATAAAGAENNSAAAAGAENNSASAAGACGAAGLEGIHHEWKPTPPPTIRTIDDEDIMAISYDDDEDEDGYYSSIDGEYNTRHRVRIIIFY